MKFKLLFSFLFSIACLLPLTTHASVTYDWTTGVAIGSETATSSALRNIGEGSNELVYTFIPDSQLAVYFSTSTDGVTWSAPYWDSIEIPGAEFLGNELPTAFLPSESTYAVFLQTPNDLYLNTAQLWTYNLLTGSTNLIPYTTLGPMIDPDIAFFPQGEGYGLMVWGMARNGAGDYLFTTASTTGDFSSDTFTSSTQFLVDSNGSARMDAEYVQLDEQTQTILSQFYTEDNLFSVSEIAYPIEGETVINNSSGGIATDGPNTKLQAIEIDRDGKTGIAFAFCRPNDAFENPNKCGIYFAERTGAETYANAELIVPHMFDYDPEMPIRMAASSFQSGYPIIIFSYDSTLYYAMKDPTGTGNGDPTCYQSDWSCGTIDSVDNGIILTLAAAPLVGSDGAMSVLYSSEDGVFYARGQIRTASVSSPSTSFPRAVPPTNPRISVNNNTPIIGNRIIPVVATATDATYVALSTTPDFVNASWQEIAYPNYITLPEKSGEYTIYAKFTNTSGGVSDVVTSGILYEPSFDKMNEAFTQILQSFIQALLEPNTTSTFDTLVNTEAYKPLQSESFVPGYLQMLQRNSSSEENATPKQLQPRYSCDIRPNAFSLGGSIVRDVSSKQLFLITNNHKVACPVVSTAVARSWGATTYKNVSLKGYTMTTPLPYRPGTVVVDSKTGVRYFTNTRGELHKFPSLTHYRALGYGNQAFYYDTTKSIAAFTRSADLTRRDIHPDGTLFILNKKKGEYAILHNRTLHPLTAKSLGIYKDKTSRAIPLLKGETYSIGEEWNP